ncbi:MAG: hypothetical protein HFG58_10675 [Lachnospiraceae bacterium]|jgi:hypothetical protein|nr:hypothetical protein [Lachnospiraceae bacterium]
MKVEQYSDDIKVIASGNFILKSSISNAKLHIDLKPEYDFELDLLWTFKSGNPDEDVNVSLGRHNENFLELIITNGSNPFGNGTQNPTGIATFTDGKILFCHYHFSRPNSNNPRMMYYTLYIY